MFAPNTRPSHGAKPSFAEPLLVALLVGLAVYAAAIGGIELTRGTGRIAAIWIANAVMLAAIFKRRTDEWPLILSVSYVANVLANVQAGDALHTSLVLALCNLVEVVICAFLVTVGTREYDFRRPRPMFLFALAALGPACLVSAAAASGFLSLFNGADMGSVFLSWYAADALGLVTITPLLLIINKHDFADLIHPKLLPRVALVVFTLAMTLSLIFLQRSMPLLFLAFPAIIMATFSLGFIGATFAVLLTAIVALTATLHGLGPITLMHGSFRLQIYALQLFTATAALTSVAVACLLGERDILLAGLGQAPDFHFIKNLRSEFISVNNAVARHAGFKSRSDMVGLTDRDIASPERAEVLLARERDVMEGKGEIRDLEEHLIDEDGREHWYETTKVPLKNLTGRTIGLAGVTRDITERKGLEDELAQSRDQMALIMQEMSDGLVVISADGHIVFCNEQYRRQFPMTGHLRVPGAYMPPILVAARESGEQPDIDPAEIMRNLREGGEEEVRLFDGRWLHIRTTPMSDGGATVIVSNITKVKRAEIEMRAMTQQLEVLAATDGLTGLLNRRSLDDRLEKEVARCRRGRQPISLVMIDIDRFKSLNDMYGHQAGDECLRRIAQAIQNGAKRPGDLVARYGGEEICVVLPETDEAGAIVLSEHLRIAVRDLAIPHQGSEKGIITISAGIASIVHDGQASTVSELVARADEALYAAKSAGRDRVMGWSSRLHARKSPGAS